MPHKELKPPDAPTESPQGVEGLLSQEQLLEAAPDNRKQTSAALSLQISYQTLKRDIHHPEVAVFVVPITPFSFSEYYK